MPAKKSPQDFLRIGKEKGSEQCKEEVNDSEVHKKIEASTQRGYDRVLNIWNYFAEQRVGETSAYDPICLKEFVIVLALGIDGAADDPNPGQNTVMLYWKQFTAVWRRTSPAIPPNITLSVTNFIKYELPEILLGRGIKLVTSKRKRKFGTRNHFVRLGRQLWGNDWVKYETPATRVYDWASFMAIVCSSARIGEYIESSSRAGSDRGLYYKDVTFGVFCNENSEAEFAVQLVRDAKGMTYTPDKRPEHSLYEGLVPMPLVCNAMLPMLAILISSKAFRDYATIEDLLALKPSKGEMIHLPWKDNMLEQPLFKSGSSRRNPGKIETAVAFGKRLRALGVRTGYINPPTIHDFRAEGLYWINELYSLAKRMKHAGHKDAKTFNTHYQPNNGTDGVGSYFGLEVRSIVNDLFRGLTVGYNPHLLQALPAEQQEALRNSDEIVAIDRERVTLKPHNSTIRRKELYRDKRKLVAKKLRECQKAQPYCPGANDSKVPCYHRSIFDRIRFLMPQRDRLASTLFETATLRSPTGLAALRDLIDLCEAEAEVEIRPGLEADKCQCNGLDVKKKTWRHVYTCVKANCNNFTEFCFLCNKWILGETEWSDHCQWHLTHTETLPVQCDPLVYGGVLATAGYCVFCMADVSLAPEIRLRQFLDLQSWRAHVNDHYGAFLQTRSRGEPAKCPHPGLHCDEAFDSDESLKFHLLDGHCHKFTKGEQRCAVVESKQVRMNVEFEDVKPLDKGFLSMFPSPALSISDQDEIMPGVNFMDNYFSVPASPASVTGDNGNSESISKLSHIQLPYDDDLRTVPSPLARSYLEPSETGTNSMVDLATEQSSAEMHCITIDPSTLLHHPTVVFKHKKHNLEFETSPETSVPPKKRRIVLKSPETSESLPDLKSNNGSITTNAHATRTTATQGIYTTKRVKIKLINNTNATRRSKGQTSVRFCGVCRESGHNARTCHVKKSSSPEA